MKRVNRNSRVSLPSSLEALEKKLSTVQARIVNLTSTLDDYLSKQRSANPQIITLEQRLAAVNSKLSSLYDKRRPKEGFLNRLLAVTEFPPGTKYQIDELNKQHSSIVEQLNNCPRFNREIQACEKSLTYEFWLRSKIETAISNKQRQLSKERRVEELRAAAAANTDETRKLAASVRNKLHKQPWCPYCGGPLGPDPHADHIYPVSKGGRSVTRNMVYVCFICNGLKRDLTLMGFIRKYGLDRSAIEHRLEKLGKEF